jgi:hypothetical protein
MGEEAAERLLEKLRVFVAEQLDDEERALFVALVAPGVARAYGEPEVEGFGVAGWSLSALPASLVRALQDQGVRVVGLEP